MRAPVGDRYVLAMLRDIGGTLGGETSGHILCLDKTTTGDGLVSALQVLSVMKQTGRSLIDSMSNEVVVRDDSIRELVPFEPVDYDTAVLDALAERAQERRSARSR